MSIQRYNPGLHHGAATMLPYNNGPYVTFDDHEAAIRIQAARSEAIGVETCMRSLRGLCHVWGMSHEEISQRETFDKLLAAYTMHVHRVTERIPGVGGITNPCEALASAGWQFSAYGSPESWSVWAKHPLGGACQIAELQKIGRTGFDVKATAEAFAEFLSRKGE